MSGYETDETVDMTKEDFLTLYRVKLTKRRLFQDEPKLKLTKKRLFQDEPKHAVTRRRRRTCSFQLPPELQMLILKAAFGGIATKRDENLKWMPRPSKTKKICRIMVDSLSPYKIDHEIPISSIRNAFPNVKLERISKCIDRTREPVLIVSARQMVCRGYELKANLNLSRCAVCGAVELISRCHAAPLFPIDHDSRFWNHISHTAILVEHGICNCIGLNMNSIGLFDDESF